MTAAFQQDPKTLKKGLQDALKEFETQNADIAAHEKEIAQIQKTQKVTLQKIFALASNYYTPACIQRIQTDFEERFKRKATNDSLTLPLLSDAESTTTQEFLRKIAFLTEQEDSIRDYDETLAEAAKNSTISGKFAKFFDKLGGGNNHD